MPGTDDGGARPALGTGGTRGGSAEDISRGNRGGEGESRLLPGGLEGTGAHPDDRAFLNKQIISGVGDQHDAGARGRPFQPPAILRAPSSLLAHPLFLHPVPQLGAPLRAPSLPPFLPAPLLFAPPALPVPADSAAPQTQTQEAPQTTLHPADVPSPKVELSVTSSAIDTVPTSVKTPSSTNTALAAASPPPSPEITPASTTSTPAPDISPIAASLVDSSFTSPGTSDILPVTNSGAGVGGKVAAACVIGAVFLLLLNWAFWLVIRRRRRARRSLPAHWDFAAPPRLKGHAGRKSEDAFAHSEDERVAERDVKGDMVSVPV